MIEGRVYRCQNRSCGCEIKVVKPSVHAASNPRCSCGAEMKKPYTKPAVRVLDEPVAAFANLKTDRRRN
jgi:predicted nucleic acid-binding Zn ribbon protein